MNFEKKLFSLISSEICSVALCEEMNGDITLEEINKIYILSKQHDMAHVVASVLLKTRMFCNDDMSQILQNELIEKIYLDSQREYAAKEIFSIFEVAKLPFIPLKGVVISQYYPDTWMRTSCDIDVLIYKKDVHVAITLLINSGFRRIKDGSPHDYSLVSPNGVHIELHFTLQQIELPKADKILENMWQHVYLKQGYSYFYEMEPEMFILYHLAHMAKHLLHGGCGIRSFIDLWLIEKKMSYDKDKLKSLLRDAGLLEFWNTTYALSKEWMEGIPHSQKTETLAEYVLEVGTYGTIKNGAKVQAGNGGSKLEFFLQLVFLPRANLEVVYPNLKKHPYLFPLYYVRRCFRIFQKSKRNMVTSMITTRNQVTDAETKNSRKMLEQLGLME